MQMIEADKLQFSEFNKKKWATKAYGKVKQARVKTREQPDTNKQIQQGAGTNPKSNKQAKRSKCRYGRRKQKKARLEAHVT